MKRLWLAISLIVALGAITYANSFDNPFMWDDGNLIVDNPYIKDASFFKDLFTKDLVYGTQFSNFYRPLQSLSFMLDYHLWDLKPFGFHLTNLLLHLGCAVLVYLVLALIFPAAQSIPLISALLFLVHPVQTEAVTYISGRADPQASMFMLLSIFFYIKHSQKAKPKNAYYFSAAILSFILALLTKETALILPLLILLYDLSFASDGVSFRNKCKFRYSLLLLVALVYILLRATALNFLNRPLFLSNAGMNLRLLTSAKIFALYLGILILPLHLRMERSLPIVSSVIEKDVLCSLILLTLLAVLIVRSYRYSRACFFGGVWFFLSLLPVSNIVPLNANMAEHWLYLPSVGFFLLVALGVNKLLKRTQRAKILTIVLLSGLVAFYSALTIKRNRDWKDPQSFFEQILIYNPQSVEAHNSLGGIYQNQGKFDLAIKEFKQATKLDPYNFKPYGNLGSVLRKKKEYDLAITAYQKALKLRPDIPGLYNNLGNVYTDQGNYIKAKTILLKGLDLFPEFALCRVNLGRVHYEMGDIPLAIKEYKQAISLEPDLVLAHYNLAIAYHRQGKHDLAIGQYKRVLNMAPEHVNTHLNLGAALNMKGRLDEAIEHSQKVLELDPSYFQAYHNLGVAYFKKQEFALAKDSFLRALSLKPGHKPSKEFLNRLEKLGY